jgi:putative ABC transport system permease protein
VIVKGVMRLERWLYSLPLRVKALFQRDEVAAAVDEELHFHIERQAAAGIDAGLEPGEARTRALRAFGGLQQRREECQELRRLNIWDSLLQDLRYAVRTARRSRGFAIGAVAVLALGIGANTAVFSVVNAVLLEPLPYPEPDRIVQIVSESPMTGYSTLASIPRFVLWRDETNVFQQMAAWHTGGPGINLTAGDWPEHLKAVNASAEYFELFGARLLAGRTFSAGEDRPGGPRVVILSNGLWRRRFASDRAILGRTILLGRESHEVIGVLDARLTPDPAADVWLPLQADRYSTDQTRFLQVAARLKPGAGFDVARIQVFRTMLPFRQKYPLAMGPHEGFAVMSLSDAVVGKVRPALQLLSGAVIFVLLIACANGASLLLSRANRRRSEIATRAALGAQRERLVRQLLSESLTLALAGGVLGLALGYVAVRAIVAWSAAEIPRLAGGVPLDWRVLAFTLIISAVTGIAFGLLPALSASRVDLSTAFKLGGENATPAGQHRLHSVLVVAEMMLALVLLVGAGLMIRTFLAERSFDRGFNPEHVLALDMALGSGSFDQTIEVTTLVRNALLRLQDRASISAIAVSRALPVDPSVELPFTIVNRALFGRGAGGPFHGGAGVQSVSPDYFKVFQIRLMRGRTFTHMDRAGAPPVAIINESMARRFWQSARQVQLEEEKITIGATMGAPFEDVPRHIIGVVADVRNPDTGRAPGPLVYVPADQMTDALTSWNNRLFPLTWVVRTSVEPRLVASMIQQQLRDAAGGLPVARVRTMTDVLAATTARTNFTMVLFTVFAGVALVLAATGMYALMSYSVQQRTQEIGIRIAFGARPADLRNAVVFQSARLSMVGVALGVAVALVFTRLMVTLIFGIQSWDPTVFVLVALLLSGVSLTAAYVPARRATRVSPLEALRGS